MAIFFQSGSAWDFSPEGALPVNENVPRGDDVWSFLVTWTVSVAGRGPAVGTFIISGGRAELWQVFFRSAVVEGGPRVAVFWAEP